MNQSQKETLWKQFGASIDMLENAIALCPAELWNTDRRFWYSTYHCLFYLDYYLTLNPDGFSPPPPFTLSELDPSGAMPERVYTKEELLRYVRASKDKCHKVIAALTEETAGKRWVNESINNSFFEMLIYNMRHVQHHTAQLNMHLRQVINDAPKWVAQTEMDL